MGRLITYLEDRHPRKDQCRHGNYKEFYDKHGVNFGKVSTRIDYSTVKGTKKRHFIEIYRLDKFVDQLYEDNQGAPRKLEVVQRAGEQIRKNLSKRIQEIDSISNLFTLTEVGCVKSLAQYLESLKDMAGDHGQYILGTEIYANHRWAIEKIKSYGKNTLDSLRYETKEYRTVSRLSSFLQRDRGFCADLVKEQRKYVNRQEDINLDAKRKEVYDPAKDFLVFEAELLYKIGMIAGDKKAKELAQRKGYRPQKKRGVIRFFNSGRKKGKTRNSSRRH